MLWKRNGGSQTGVKKTTSAAKLEREEDWIKARNTEVFKKKPVRQRGRCIKTGFRIWFI